MYLSMFFETTFPIFEKNRDKYTLNIGNPLLYLHMCGTPQPTRMANMNVSNIGMGSSLWLASLQDCFSQNRMNQLLEI